MPAPSRWVVAAPGQFQVVVQNATDFSPWLQPDDQAAEAVTYTSAPVPAETGGKVINYDSSVLDPPAPADNADLETTTLADELSVGGDAGAGLSVGEMTVSHTAWTIVEGGDPADDDPFQIRHVLHGSRGASGVTVAVSAKDLKWPGDIWLPGGSIPANAIGYEVEQVELAAGFWVPAAEPISAQLEVTLSPSTYFGSVTNAEAFAVLNQQWGEGPVSWGYAPGTSPPLLALNIQRTAPATLAATLDALHARVATFAPYSGAAPSPHTEAVTIADLSASPPYSGLLGFQSTVRNIGGTVSVNNGDTLEVSANATVAGIYVIRPPRIRWIYAEPQTATSTAYRRIYPRDDALGSGSSRNWPRSKSLQSGQRVGGGYL